MKVLTAKLSSKAMKDWHAALYASQMGGVVLLRIREKSFQANVLVSQRFYHILEAWLGQRFSKSYCAP